jgi:integrase
VHTQRNRRSISGNIYLQPRAKGPQWYWRIRLPEGSASREERKPIGPAWTGSGRTPDGYYTRRTAQAALDARLTDLRRGIGIPEKFSGAVVRDAAEDWYTHGKQHRKWKPSTQRDYRSALDCHVLPAFGDWKLEEVTTKAVEQWRARCLADGTQSDRMALKTVTMLHGIYERARKTYALASNPIADVEPLKLTYDDSDYDFYEPEQVWALARAAADERDAATYVTAAFAGLRRGELLALRLRDLDFGGSTIRVMRSLDHRAGFTTPKSGKGRSVPMVDDVARVLAKLLQRERFTSPDDLVFCNEIGGSIDGSALRRRYKAAQKRAKLPEIRFHDLRHTFGSLAAREPGTAPRELQAWMGHADARTTARYTHHRPRTGEARRLSRAFKAAKPGKVAA